MPTGIQACAAGLGLSVIMLIAAGCSSKSSGGDAPAPGVTEPTLLAPPPRGQGFQLKVDPFPVAAGDEVQDCYFFQVKDVAAANGMDPEQPVDVHRIQAVQRAGSHHMNVFRVKTIVKLDPGTGAVQRGLNGVGECFKSPNWADWPLVTNTQQGGNVDWTYPDGVANELGPDEWLMLQTHYVNATSQGTPAGSGAVSVNFYTIPKDQVKAQLGTVFATKQSIRVCSKNPAPHFAGSCQFKSQEAVTIIGANGHFHSRGRRFDMYTWDGAATEQPPDAARFYRSERWDDPPMAHSPALETVVPPGGGVYYTCDFAWTPPDPAIGCDALNAYDQTKYMTPQDQLDCCYTFGPIVEKNEHCNAFVYYYPKSDDVNCF